MRSYLSGLGVRILRYRLCTDPLRALRVAYQVSCCIRCLLGSVHEGNRQSCLVRRLLYERLHCRVRNGQHVPTVVRTVEAKLTASHISVALLALLCLPLLSRRMQIFALFCAVLIAAIAASGLFTPSQLWSTVLLFLAASAILLIVTYISQWFWLSRISQQVLPLEVKYVLSEAGCDVTCDSWSRSFPASSFSGVARFHSVVLVEIKGHRATTEAAREFLKAYEATRDAQHAERMTQPLGLPMIWLRPVSERTYLVIPFDSLDRSQWTELRHAWLPR
jgi:hypothetical protein